MRSPGAAAAVLLFPLAALALAACSDDESGPTGPAGQVGDYTLQTVDGASLPVSVGGSQSTVLLQGQMSLLIGNDYDLVLEVRDKNGDETYLESGFWGTFALDSIFFVPDRQGVAGYRGTVANGILRVTTPDGLALQFQR
ncbi:MAG: hypothetical protein M8860_00700 [marine benthic group bacterium]|jgi:hypothetical protein|nr:hypothetical protein [Gemmatimonadota bacterium]MCL7961351.1 hypothetical protein [Candidatus Carthagonibacter metallireducens]MCL7937151.1 hypothetical protein [Gemmatimonadota bacterium]MCL7956826.1 hypothetical protein [Gemmatimonadota bacterium]MCL7964920.1 hypothetical protein [Gemmatimonadota bacterium]